MTLTICPQYKNRNFSPIKKKKKKNSRVTKHSQSFKLNFHLHTIVTLFVHNRRIRVYLSIISLPSFARLHPGFNITLLLLAGVLCGLSFTFYEFN